jgi:hypothetical protein
MNQPVLVLLSPHQLPGQNPLVLAADEMAAWLNAYAALWHPAALWGAADPPRVDAAYDHEEPKAGHVYAIPETPALLLPEDWPERVRAAGAVTFRATPDRPTTLANLKQALGAVPEPSPDEPGETDITTPAVDSGEETAIRVRLIDLDPVQAGPFFGIGLGYLLIATLCEAMEHQNLLAAADFWADVQRAIAALAGVPYVSREPADSGENLGGEDANSTNDWAGSDEFSHLSGDAGATEPDSPDEVQTTEDFANGSEPESPGESPDGPESETVVGPEACRRCLQSAADRLASAREVLYPVAIHLIDIVFLDDKRLDAPWPACVDRGIPVNIVAAAATLEKLAHEQPERLALLREKVQSEQVEVCGGSYLERDDALLPVESQVWNLSKGLTVTQQLLGSDIHVYARRRFAAHPQLPVFLSAVGLQRMLLLSFDDAVMPTYQVTVINWPAPDGKQIEAFTRAPYPADNVQTFFHLAHYLFQTIRQDHSATVALLHTGSPAGPWYEDWLELCRFGPILGQWTTLSHYFNDVLAGEHVSSLAADEFQSDYLSHRIAAQRPDPVGGFARHARLRRRLDTAWSLAALLRGLAGRNDPLQLDGRLAQLEDRFEATDDDPGPDLVKAEQEAAEALASRLLARAQEGGPGYLILNPCSFTRRVALELDEATTPLPIAGPVKACQIDGDRLRLVVEVPALGFCWFPKAGPPGTPPAKMRMRLADGRCVRNEFFEAEIDQETGGLRAFRDHRVRNNRLGQRLVFSPGSTMRATSVTMTSAGPALGEIVTEGVLVGEQEQVLARFRQRLRAWLGRPVLDLRIEIYPEQPPAGYGWHAYYGARFAWRDERATLLRGVNGSSYITTQTRPQTPDYLELRMSRQSTVIFPGGLPFHQRHENRMLDVILIPEGEKGQVFDLALALDREHPMQTALGMITPVPLVPTPKGPPHVGAAGWLFHLDAPNLVLTGLRPVTDSNHHPADAVRVRCLECSAYGGQADLRCPRDPHRAALLDVRGTHHLDASTQGDAASFEVMPGDLVNLQVDFE